MSQLEGADASIAHQKIDSQPVSMGSMGKPLFMDYTVSMYRTELRCEALFVMPVVMV